MKTYISFIFILFFTQSYSQSTQDIKTFTDGLQKSFEELTNELVKFNLLVINSNNQSTIQSGSDQLLELSKNKIKFMKSLPKLEKDSSYYNNSLTILNRQITKINSINELYRKYDQKNWNAFLLTFMIANKNTGKESNLLMKELNEGTIKIFAKYKFIANTNKEAIARVGNYNLAMDHVLQNQIIYYKMIITYNELLQLINTNNSIQIKSKTNLFIPQLDSLNKEASTLKNYKNPALANELSNCLLEVQKICKNEVVQIYNLFETGIKTEKDEQTFKQTTKSLTEKTQKAQNSYNKKVQNFILDASKEVESKN